jgi:PDZ domain
VRLYPFVPYEGFRNLFCFMPRDAAKMNWFAMMGLLASILAGRCFGQSSLTDVEVVAAMNRALSGKHHAIGLRLNDVQTNLLSGLLCETCRTTGYTIFVYTPESWIELKAVQARREMLPFDLEDVTPEMRLPYIHVLASPSSPEYLNASGMGMASSVHRVVLSSTDRLDIIQPLSESHEKVESNSALRSFTQASAGAVFSMKDIERLRSEDPSREFFIVVVGDNQNKYFKVKSKFFKQLFGQDAQFADRKPTLRRPKDGKQISARNQHRGAKSSSTARQPEVIAHNSTDDPVTSRPGVSALATTDLPAPTKIPDSRSTAPNPGAAISSTTAGNEKSRRGEPAEFDVFQRDSALIATWWNIKNPDGDASMVQSNDVSIGAWSDEKPRVEHDGVKIDRLAPNGPADEAGVQVGDYILALGGIYVFTVEELAQNIRRYPPGAKVSLRYRRRSIIYDTFVLMSAEATLKSKQ